MTDGEKVQLLRLLTAIKAWWLAPPGTADETAAQEEVVDSVDAIQREMDR